MLTNETLGDIDEFDVINAAFDLQ